MCRLAAAAAAGDGESRAGAQKAANECTRQEILRDIIIKGGEELPDWLGCISGCRRHSAGRPPACSSKAGSQGGFSSSPLLLLLPAGQQAWKRRLAKEETGKEAAQEGQVTASSSGAARSFPPSRASAGPPGWLPACSSPSRGAPRKCRCCRTAAAPAGAGPGTPAREGGRGE